MLRRISRVSAPLSMTQARFTAAVSGVDPSQTKDGPKLMDWKTATPQGSTKNDSGVDDLLKLALVGGAVWYWLWGPGYNEEAPYHK